MSNKIALLAFTASVLFVSFAMMVIPQASALTNSGVDTSHVTARFEGNLKVCGSHLCAPGEKTFWDKTVWGSQHMNQGKISNPLQHGEDVMKKMSGATPNPTTAHGTAKPMAGMHVTTNGTKSANMTGNAPTGTK